MPTNSLLFPAARGVTGVRTPIAAFINQGDCRHLYNMNSTSVKSGDSILSLEPSEEFYIVSNCPYGRR